MTPEKALELSNQYGVATVILFIVVFYLGGLVWYIFKQSREREVEQAAVNAKREERLANLIEIHLKSSEEKTTERHVANQASMAVLAEADRRQREEHVQILENQKACEKQHESIMKILDGMLLRLNLKANTQ